MKRHRWYPIGSHEVGLECLGEFRMDAVAARLEIRTEGGKSVFSAVTERFYIPYWNAQYGEPDAWNNPLISSEDGRFLYVIWLPKGGSLQSVLLDLERHGGYRFDSVGTPRRILFFPDGGEIGLCHHLSPYHADLFLRDWETDSEEPVKVHSGGFEVYSELFGLQNEEVEQAASGNLYQPVVPSTFSVTSTSFPELGARLRW